MGPEYKLERSLSWHVMAAKQNMKDFKAGNKTEINTDRFAKYLQFLISGSTLKGQKVFVKTWRKEWGEIFHNLLGVRFPHL